MKTKGLIRRGCHLNNYLSHELLVTTMISVTVRAIQEGKHPNTIMLWSTKSASGEFILVFDAAPMIGEPRSRPPMEIGG